MSQTIEPTNRYWVPIDEDAKSAHAFCLQLVGRNKRVLELGPAAGAVTRALVGNGCRVVGVEVDADAAAHLEEVAERIVVGDLSDPAVVASAIDDEGFDVVLAGDVLEHLPRPLDVLRACRPALKPGGYVVISLPNIAHADVKLQLLSGRFPYRDVGLLDRTHVHFFTRESIGELLRDAGFVAVDVRRVVVPVFQTELAVDSASVAPEVLASATADAESETYQFVVRAVVHDGDAEVAALADRVVSVSDELETERARRVLAESQAGRVAEALRAATEELEALRHQVDEIAGRAAEFERTSREHEEHVRALRSTRSYRMLAPFRALRGLLR